MSDPKPTLAEPWAACCPCLLSAKSGSWCCNNLAARCRCYEKARPGHFSKLPKHLVMVDCSWPGHALAAEVAEMERKIFESAVAEAQATGFLNVMEERAEVSEALLREAPEPPLFVGTNNMTRWTYETLRPWLARVRAAVSKP